MSSDAPAPEPYRIEFSRNADYLHAFVDGLNDSAAISKSYWMKVFDECRKEGIGKVLVEENLAQNLSASEAYDVGRSMADSSPEGLAVAFVDRRADHQELNRFGNLVANNRGLDSQVFDSVEEARKWLAGGQAGERNDQP
jgi:hypothetical protein